MFAAKQKVTFLVRGRVVSAVVSAVLVSSLLLVGGCGDTSSTPSAPEPPATQAPPAVVEDFDLGKVVFLHGNPINFPVNAEITSAAVSGNRNVNVKFRKPGYSKSKDGRVDGNIWIFGKVKGQWYAATFEWLLAGASQFAKPLEWEGRQPPFIQTKARPLNNEWYPQDGETVYFMVSSMTRAGVVGGAQGRSKPFKATWHK